MVQKKMPLRRCTGCRQMRGKNELIRVVHDGSGQFSLDFTGKKPGRGAYVCCNIECLDKAHKARGLERSFKSAVPRDVYDALRNELQSREEGGMEEKTN